MTVHRTRFHRTRLRGTPHPVAAPGQAPSSPGPGEVTTRPRRSLTAALTSRLSADRGDVPGWVLITLMTAAIVVALWAVASEQIVQIFHNAMAPFIGREL